MNDKYARCVRHGKTTKDKARGHRPYLKNIRTKEFGIGGHWTGRWIRNRDGSIR